jgi:hypothetical protein
VTPETLHISVRIERPASVVYEFAADPANLPRWAAGLGASIVETADGWRAASPMGEVGIVFVPRNEFGVLDHWVTLPSGETVYNPLRVLVDGTGCEAVFTLHRAPGVGDEAFAADAAAVRADLETLQSVLEGDPASQVPPVRMA